MIERVDGYRPDGTRAGVTFVRGEPIPVGLLHPVVEVAVRHADGTFLLMRRDLDKPGFPGCWEAGASGSVLAGEGFEAAARRELLEETGLIPENLVEISRNAYGAPDFLYMVSYRCDYSGDKRAVRLQEGETIDFRWLSPSDMPALMATAEFVSPQAVRLRENGVLG